MPRLLTDENFNGDILRGLTRRLPALDIVRVQDEGLANTDDAIILDWAGQKDRVLLTHDIKTMPPLAHQRVAEGKSMPGIVVVRELLPVGRAIDDLVVLIECSLESEWKGQVRYLPL
jgi:predicted nuclease of predicted toxin-antitoxin system